MQISMNIRNYLSLLNNNRNKESTQLSYQEKTTQYSPCAAHDLWSVEGEGVALVRL